MAATKKMGIWIDYSMAYLMEFASNPFEIKTVESTSFDPTIIYPINKLAILLEKRKRLLLTYYNKIAREITNYDRIILFGPSNAKIELFDLLSEDEQFVNTKIEITNTDKMSSAEQHVFIQRYFSNK